MMKTSSFEDIIRTTFPCGYATNNVGRNIFQTLTKYFYIIKIIHFSYYVHSASLLLSFLANKMVEVLKTVFTLISTWQAIIHTGYAIRYD